MFQKNYAGKILECHLNLLNRIRVGGYLPDRVTNLILQYLSNRYILLYQEFIMYFVYFLLFNSIILWNIIYLWIVLFL